MRLSSKLRLSVCAIVLVGLLGLGAGCAKKPPTQEGTRSSAGTATASADATGGSAASSSTTGSGQASATAGGSVTGAQGGSTATNGAAATTKSGTTTKSGITTQPAAKGKATLAVIFINGAKTKPLTHVEIRSGSAVFKPGTNGRMDSGELAGLPASGGFELVIYPDGADGKKIVIPMDLKADFAAGKQPKVEVAISDTNVQVLRYGAKSMGMATYPRF